MAKANKSLKVGHLNTRSLLNSFSEFKKLVLDNNFFVLCVTETWLDNNTPTSAIDIDGLNFFRNDRGTRGGGVGIYVNNTLKVKHVLNSFQSVLGVEQMFLEVYIYNVKFLIGVIYRVPHLNLKQFVEHLDNLLSLITPQYDNILLLGDFNIDHTFHNLVTECLESYEFEQLISEPTRVTRISSKIIDVIYTNNIELVKESGVINSDLISDHMCIYTDLFFNSLPNVPKIIAHRDFRNFSLESFLIDLQGINFDAMLYLKSIDDKIILLNEKLSNLFHKHAPFRVSRITKQFSPWLTNSIKCMIADKDKALAKFKRSKNINDWKHYKQLRNLTVASIRREKSAFLKVLERDPDKQKIWHALNQLNVRNKPFQEIPEKLKNPMEINNYFISIFKNKSDISNACLCYNNKKFNSEITFSFKLASVEEVNDIVHRLKSNATGYDGISSKMLKLCSPLIDKYLTHIINCCLEAGYFPEVWKFILVKPLPKIKDPKSYSDLRPISLIPLISKILEKVIYQHIYDYTTDNNIIPFTQSGFRKNFSTTTLLTDVTDNIIRSVDNGEALALVLLDYSKAFDTIDHKILCLKLEYYGFDNKSIEFFKSYLTNRRQKVVLDNFSSDFQSILAGVPQGSVLGPLLFLIYTADIHTSVEHSKIQAFADDQQVAKSFKPSKIDEALTELNSDLESIAMRSEDLNLKINPDKCSVILFSFKKINQQLKNNFNPLINKKSLKVVSSVKNLGLILDENLRFKEHVNNIVRRSYNILRLLYKNYLILNFKLRKKLTESLVLSIVNYCFVVYYPCLDQVTKYRLQKIQNSCCRFIYGLKRRDHVSKFINDLGWLKLDLLYEYFLCMMIYRILNTSVPLYLREKLQFRRNVHHVNVRSSNKLSLMKFNTTLFKRSFTYNAIICFNNVPEKYKKKNLLAFRKKIKTFLFEKQIALHK